MVKFAKQLQLERVPEWEAAYMNYAMLKKELKAVKRHRQVPDGNSEGDSVSFLWPNSTRDSTKAVRRTSSIAKVQALVEKSRQALALKLSPKLSHHHDLEDLTTELPERVGLDAPFFSLLDTQLSKVNEFYRIKEVEFVEQAHSLEEQMQTLLEMRRKLSRRKTTEGSESSGNLHEAAMFATQGSGRDDHEDDLEARHVRTPTGARRTESQSPRSGTFHQLHDQDDHFVVHLENIEEEPAEEMGEINTSQSELPSKNAQKLSRQLTMKMNIPITTPGATISAVSRSLWEDIVKQVNRSWSDSHGQRQRDGLDLTQKNIKLADKMLRAAFIELYRGLELLKGYSKFNMLGFAKITKKYDKILGRHARSVYLADVETSYFGTSNEVMKLMEKVEATYTKHFAHGNRKKAMLALRPRQKRASHRTTFLLGFFFGGVIFLTSVFAIFLQRTLPRYRPVKTSPEVKPGPGVYYQTIFPTFSLVMLILLHMYMYGCDLFFWRKMRINFSFMFGFKPGTELRHRPVFMVTSILSTALMISMIGHLALSNASHIFYVDLVPLTAVMVLGALLFNPFDICYRSSRVFFLRALYHCMLAPLYKVALPDFFLADQLTSQVVMLRNLQFVVCYYFGGAFRTGDVGKCRNNDVFQALTHVVVLAPFWWRLMQSVRRRFDDADRHHAFNGLKYFAAMVAIGMKIEYELNRKSNFWLGMLIGSSIVAFLFQVYWDLVVDWGLLQRHSINPWLRDELIMPNHKGLYFISMVVNAILRLAWLQTIVRVQLFGLDRLVMDFIFGALEVLRRGLWNFYRLENEHIGNVGKFRATKALPLPFEHRSDEDEED